jgi:NAD(P)H-flavin reductase
VVVLVTCEGLSKSKDDKAPSTHWSFPTHTSFTSPFLAEDDILVRPELEALAKQYPDRFQIFYTLDRPPKGWTQGSGFITEEMIRDHLYIKPTLGAQIQIFMCGPPIMVKKACIPNLENLGFSERDWYVF